MPVLDRRPAPPRVHARRKAGVSARIPASSCNSSDRRPKTDAGVRDGRPPTDGRQAARRGADAGCHPVMFDSPDRSTGSAALIRRQWVALIGCFARANCCAKPALGVLGPRLPGVATSIQGSNCLAGRSNCDEKMRTAFGLPLLLLWAVSCGALEVVELSSANFEHQTQAATGQTTGHWWVTDTTGFGGRAPSHAKIVRAEPRALPSCARAAHARCLLHL